MPIETVFASLAVSDINRSAPWYETAFGQKGRAPMPELLEWSFPRGGTFQIYQLPERAGAGSCTLAVSNLDQQIRKLESMGVVTRERTESPQVTTVMVTDPDGNHIASAQALSSGLAR